ncbi:PREDICTED: RHOMBOID-like protein 9, chloroplastic isoform X2 [Tarenaya hassleriana]|uniref:RHOMBOID-like protein 9, chloroplastic isoform X2 n=1 Tax=Tarenaya hassleriana TaxID=28532 RepID=UPI00053C9B0C|nr:PREDICTED: RHOMBOID-like protein 9, chloroplastic isoform X2 [Tarenaya hassleriana]
MFYMLNKCHLNQDERDSDQKHLYVFGPETSFSRTQARIKIDFYRGNLASLIKSHVLHHLHYSRSGIVFFLGSESSSKVYMALLPVHHDFPCKEHIFPNETSSRQCKGEISFDANGSRRFSPIRISSYKTSCAFDMLMRAGITSTSVMQHGMMNEATVLNWDCRLKSQTKSTPYRLSTRGKYCLVRASLEPNTTEQQLRLLDSYFGKLQGDGSKLSSRDVNTETDQKVEIDAEEEELESLNAYLGKLCKDTSMEGLVSKGSSGANPLSKLSYINSQNVPFGQLNDDLYDDTSNFYLVLLASINVGVCLFEVASPVRNNEMGLLSIPLLYGSKINDLIMAGEWWRLVTPMFLHSGILHVALSSWALLTFGPKVCRFYGPFTFFLIFILGGISGNFISFLHTPYPTVGGTGPAFAIIGAWLVHQTQNKDTIKEDELEDLYQKAIVMTGLGLILSHFGPIDDWTNLGAILSGIGYGFFTCPVPELDESSSRNGREEGVAVMRRSAGPCKSLFVFAVFLAVIVSSLVLFVDGPFDIPTFDDIVYSLV